MAISLKPVDVAVIGLGAAGGVAVLPLARAGLKIAGLEAGTWMDPHKDFHADEVYNNVAAFGDQLDQGSARMPHPARDAFAAGSIAGVHPMMNAIGGTSIHYWAQSWRLKPWDFRTRARNRSSLWAQFDSRRVHARRLARHLRRIRAVLRHH